MNTIVLTETLNYTGRWDKYIRGYSKDQVTWLELGFYLYDNELYHRLPK